MSEYSAAIAACSSYAPEEVARAMAEAVGTGLDFVTPGMRVGIKPNLCAARGEDSAACTHPALITELVKMIVARGGVPVIGESPGGLYNATVLRRHYAATGMLECAAAGAILNDDFTDKEASFPAAKAIKRFTYTAWLDSVDALISFSKLKTHGMMAMTGAVKNLYGTIPGTLKLEYHYHHPNHADFADMLVDLAEYFKPRLSIIDAVVGMEGNGPTAGTPRHIGCIIASASPYCADLLGARILNIPAMEVPTVAAAAARGLAPDSHEKVVTAGDVEKYVVHDCLHIPRREIAAVQNIGAGSQAVLRILFARRPRAIKKLCIGCGLCANLCPAKAITMKNKLPQIEREKCIRCFCCQEFCPKGAMRVHRTFIARLLNK